MSELWKPIFGYEDLYEVSSEGRVRSKPRLVNAGTRGTYWRKGKVLRPQKRQHGYLSVWLYTSNGRQQISVHRLVAEAFCERKHGKDEVNHLNEDKTDNRAVNLQWCTRLENCSYGNRSSTIGRKLTNGKMSKPVRQYTLSGEFIKEYPSHNEASRQTGIKLGSLWYAVKHNGSVGGYKWGCV